MKTIFESSKKYFTLFSVLIAAALCFIAKPLEVSAADKPSKVIITSAESVNYNTVKISWKKADDAQKYEIYRATSLNGTYTKIATTKNRSYSSTKLTTGKKYYYKVRGINGTTKGTFSAKKAVTPVLNKVGSFKASKKTLTSIKVTWNKVAGAKGYQVYRSTSKNGTYKKIKTTTSNSYTNTGLTTNKTYYYKVRAYRVVNGANKYSEFSTIKSVRLPIRDVATQYSYKLSDDETVQVANTIFNDDVIITGECARIVFSNCIFNADVILKSSEFTSVILNENTVVIGECIIKNNIKESTLLASACPRFISFTDKLSVTCKNCYGLAVIAKDGKLVFNGTEYTPEDTEIYYDGNTDDYVTWVDQEITLYGVSQWWENGEKVVKVISE